MTKHHHRRTQTYNPMKMTQDMTKFTIDMTKVAVVSGVAIGTASIVAGIIKK